MISLFVAVVSLNVVAALQPPTTYVWGQLGHGGLGGPSGLFRVDFATNNLELVKSGFTADFVQADPTNKGLIVFRKVNNEEVIACASFVGVDGTVFARFARPTSMLSVAISTDLKSIAFTAGDYKDPKIYSIKLPSGTQERVETTAAVVSTVKFHPREGFVWLERQASGTSRIMGLKPGIGSSRLLWKGDPTTAFAFVGAGKDLLLGQTTTDNKPKIVLTQLGKKTSKIIPLPTHWGGSLKDISLSADRKFAFIRADFNLIAVEMSSGKALDFHNSMWYTRPVQNN